MDVHVHSYADSGPTLPGGRVGMGDLLDTAVVMVCSRQLQGQAGGQRWPRGQRLLLED